MANSSLFLQTLNGKKTARPPFWFMRQAGRYLPEYKTMRKQKTSFLSLCLSPKSACEVTLQPIRRLNTDAAIIFSDILIVPLGLGVEVDFIEGKGPILDAVKNEGDLKTLSFSKNSSKLDATYEAIGRVREALPEEKTLIGFAGSPWTVATYMVEGQSTKDFTKVKTWAYSDPESFDMLINILTEATIEHLIKQIEAGADVVKLFDSWAGALSPLGFTRWVVKPTREICRCLKKIFPSIKIIGFPKGAAFGYFEYAETTGVDAIALDTAICPITAGKEIPRKTIIQGNLDPISLIVGGKAMFQETQTILDALAHRPFIFNLGHGVQPTTPPENVEALSEFLLSLE